MAHSVTELKKILDIVGAHSGDKTPIHYADGNIIYFSLTVQQVPVKSEYGVMLVRCGCHVGWDKHWAIFTKRSERR